VLHLIGDLAQASTQGRKNCTRSRIIAPALSAKSRIRPEGPVEEVPKRFNISVTKGAKQGSTIIEWSTADRTMDDLGQRGVGGSRLDGTTREAGDNFLSGLTGHIMRTKSKRRRSGLSGKE